MQHPRVGPARLSSPLIGLMRLTPQSVIHLLSGLRTTRYAVKVGADCSFQEGGSASRAESSSAVAAAAASRPQMETQ